MNTILPTTFGLVASGEAMYIPLQAGFAMELGSRLVDLGYGDRPYDVAIGSSSGSLVATAAAAGDFDHDRIRTILVDFVRDTRPRPRLPLNPYPSALQTVLDKLAPEMTAAAHGRTDLVVTASQLQPEAFRDVGMAGISATLSGLVRFWSRHDSSGCDLIDGVERMIQAAARLVRPRYFSTKTDADRADGRDWRSVSTAKDIRFAVNASTRILGLYGWPMKDGTDSLIDGAFADNAPVELALELGAANVFVVTSSRSGNVFDRPFQNIARRNIRKTLETLEKYRYLLQDLPQGERIFRRLRFLKEIQDTIPAPAALNLDELRERYPRQAVHVIHPSGDLRISRFFESDINTLNDLYDEGRELARGLSLPKPSQLRLVRNPVPAA